MGGHAKWHASTGAIGIGVSTCNSDVGAWSKAGTESDCLGVFFAGLFGLAAGTVFCACCVHAGMQRRRALSTMNAMDRKTPGAAGASGHDPHSFSISHSL